MQMRKPLGKGFLTGAMTKDTAIGANETNM